MPSSLLEQVSVLLREAAVKIILPYFGNLKPEDIEEKTQSKIIHGTDWVLVVDKKTEEFLSETLQRLLPGSVVLGEEGCAASPELLKCLSSSDFVWILDPLDGTTNFKNNIPYFGILVALYHQGQILASWTFHPLTKELIVAEKGGGAWAGGKRISVLKGEVDCRNLSLIFNTALPHSQSEEWITACKPEFKDVAFSRARIGAYDYPSLCMSQLNPEAGGGFLKQEHSLLLYIDKPMKPWDHAAGLLLVEEAGGYARTLDGNRPDLSNLSRGILVTPDATSWRAAQEKILYRRPFPVI